MDSPHESTFELVYDDERRARVVERSVAREVDDMVDDRSRARVDRDGATVTVHVVASDLTALRAAQNTWLTLVAVAEEAVDAAERYGA
ncbi:KEOPS complex subunit Pcc1 [Halobacteriaceae archaeon GCM10025711]